MVAKEFPKTWPPIKVNPFDDIPKAYLATRDGFKSVGDLRTILSQVFDDLGAINVISTGSTVARTLADRFAEVAHVPDFAGSDAGLKIQAAHDSLPAAGGVIDARGLTGAQTAAATINLSKRCLLLAGAATLTCSGSPGIDIKINGVTIRGISQAHSSIAGDVNSNHLIRGLGTNGNGNRELLIEQVTLTDSVGSRTAGDALNITKGTGINGIATMRDVNIDGFNRGVYCEELITSMFERVRSNDAIAEGFYFSLASTSITLNNCFANAAGADGFRMTGAISYSSFINTASDNAGGDAYSFEEVGGLFPSGITMISPGAESPTGNCMSTAARQMTIIAPFFLNGANGIVLVASAEGIQMIGGRVTDSSGYGFDATNGNTAMIIGTNLDGHTTGKVNDPSNVVSWINDRFAENWDIAGGLQIDSGGTLKGMLTATTTWDPASIAVGAVVSTTVTVTGAAIGDVALAQFDLIGTNDVLVSAHVETANTVRVILHNKAGGARDFGNGNLRVWVFKA